MNISSSAPLSGVKASTIRQDVTAHNIANISTPSFSAKSVVQSELANNSGTAVSSIRDTGSETDLAQSMVDLNVNKTTYTANLKVLKMQDKMVGELIDLIG
jgi:flagellar basal-body rod protein FlgC